MKRISMTLVVVALLVLGSLPAWGAGASLNYTAHLQGKHEVPAVDTNAQGQATFKVARDGSSISYRLIAANIEDVVQAHIHIGSPGTNGPVVAFLFGPTGGVDSSGLLAQGTITAADLIGPLDGQTLADLIEAFDDGEAYVNVHTVENPAGEVRGPIG
jgi:hypothetical protein